MKSFRNAFKSRNYKLDRVCNSAQINMSKNECNKEHFNFNGWIKWIKSSQFNWLQSNTLENNKSSKTAITTLEELHQSLTQSLHELEIQKSALWNKDKDITESMEQHNIEKYERNKEIELLSELNFKMGYQIADWDFLLSNAKEDFENWRFWETQQEEKRVIHLNASPIDDDNNFFTNLWLNSRKKFNTAIKDQSYNKKKIEDLITQINNINYLYESRVNRKKYIKTIDVIEEDEKEEGWSASYHPSGRVEKEQYENGYDCKYFNIESILNEKNESSSDDEESKQTKSPESTKKRNKNRIDENNSIPKLDLKECSDDFSFSNKNINSISSEDSNDDKYGTIVNSGSEKKNIDEKDCGNKIKMNLRNSQDFDKDYHDSPNNKKKERNLNKNMKSHNKRNNFPKKSKTSNDNANMNPIIINNINIVQINGNKHYEY